MDGSSFHSAALHKLNKSKESLYIRKQPSTFSIFMLPLYIHVASIYQKGAYARAVQPQRQLKNEQRRTTEALEGSPQS
jgi:hypothetical protein